MIISTQYAIITQQFFIFFSARGLFFGTFSLQINAPSRHDGCAEQMSQEQHQQRRLTSSLYVSLSTQSCLTNKTQTIKSLILKTTNGNVWSVGLIDALSSQMRHSICKRASSCLTDILKSVWNRPWFNSSMKWWESPSLYPITSDCPALHHVVFHVFCHGWCEQFWSKHLTSEHFPVV